MLRSAFPEHESFDVLIPVPLHWRRQWQRGFNQSEMLARFLSSRCGIPVATALRRVRYTAVQAGLSNTARRRNVTAAFACRRRLDGKRVLLIDDVMTTGSTAAACGVALRRAGASRISLLTVARADRRLATHLMTGGVS
jgi:ComF family protein